MPGRRLCWPHDRQGPGERGAEPRLELATSRPAWLRNSLGRGSVVNVLSREREIQKCPVLRLPKDTAASF